MASVMNTALMRITRRADQQDIEKLVSTFVDVGPLFTMLSSVDHQVLYGRRGTGKTHALTYLHQTCIRNGDAAVYVDLRNVGSNTSIYSDTKISFEERASRLLIDCCEAVYNKLFDYAIENECTDHLLELFGVLESQITDVYVDGPVEYESVTGAESSRAQEVSAGLNVSDSVGICAQGRLEQAETSTRQIRRRASGDLRHRVSFGGLSGALRRVVEGIPAERVWLILDEWSTIPLDLQPYLADLLRRAFFAVPNLIVKIGAIEVRCNIHLRPTEDEYIGIELGADAQADINLDDFMVFDNDREMSKNFFGDLLHKHVKSIVEEDEDGSGEEIDLETKERFISESFTQITSFAELVRASEGVPRDAINIVRLAAQRANDSKISVQHVRTASRSWYNTDKVRHIRGRERQLLDWIESEVIGSKRSRSFLLQQGVYEREQLIRRLVDERVLHILKRGYSAQDRPGVRFDVYGIDYGCYVDLLSTARAPMELDLDVLSSSVSVPEDDYRSIRRAILDMDLFHASIPIAPQS